MNTQRALPSALIAMLLISACTNERIIGPAIAGINSALELISPESGNQLTVDEDDLLYVPPPQVGNFLSADSANALRTGSDGLLFTSASAGGSGERGPEGPEGPQGPEGPKGDPGTSVKIVGSVEQASQLPSSAEPGDGYLVDGNLWVWGGSGWNNVGRVQGPPGERGPEGPQGQRGPEGPQGERGQRGPAGEQGPAGPNGEQGEKGDPGQDGAKGDKGDPGAPGIGLTTRTYGSCISCEGTNYTIEVDDPGNTLLGGVVLLQCHTEDGSEHYTVDCGAMHMDGKLVISASGTPAHDTGSFIATLIGNF